MTLTKALINPLLGRHPTCILKLASELWRELQTWSSREKTINVKRTLRSIFSGKYEGKEGGERAANFCGLFYHYFRYCLSDFDPSFLLFTLYVNLSPWTKALHCASNALPKKQANPRAPGKTGYWKIQREVSTRGLTSRSQPVPVKSPPFCWTWSLIKAPLEFGILASL